MNWIKENLFTVRKDTVCEGSLTIVCDKNNLKREKSYWNFWGFCIIKKEKIDNELLLLHVKKVDTQFEKNV